MNLKECTKSAFLLLIGLGGLMGLNSWFRKVAGTVTNNLSNSRSASYD